MKYAIKSILLFVAFVGMQHFAISKIDHHNNHSQHTKTEGNHTGHDHSKHENNSENKSTKIEVVDGITIAKIQTSAECDKCKKAIEKAINRLDGVKSSSLEVESRIFTVKFKSEDISLDKIKSVINKTGYDADETKADSKAYDRLPDCCKVGGMDK